MFNADIYHWNEEIPEGVRRFAQGIAGIRLVEHPDAGRYFAQLIAERYSVSLIQRDKEQLAVIATGPLLEYAEAEIERLVERTGMTRMDLTAEERRFLGKETGIKMRD
ncbi:MAG: hypothetical protein HYW26_04280 [Candidatus Aenigmarchaeota archaeon]|nr:hypothetical protein [Candidatus Aenigmarchaeota archaeon]